MDKPLTKLEKLEIRLRKIRYSKMFERIKYWYDKISYDLYWLMKYRERRTIKSYLKRWEEQGLIPKKEMAQPYLIVCKNCYFHNIDNEIGNFCDVTGEKVNPEENTCSEFEYYESVKEGIVDAHKG